MKINFRYVGIVSSLMLAVYIIVIGPLVLFEKVEFGDFISNGFYLFCVMFVAGAIIEAIPMRLFKC